MPELVSGDGRTHIHSRLMRESLQDRRVLSQTESDRDLRVFPDVTLVSIGGQSIFDRGKAAILPLVEELVQIKRDKSLKMVIGVGGGTRVRHTISIALDLGLPVGGMAQLVGAMEELNAILLNTLLAPHGSMPMQRDHFWDLPLYFDAGITPIAISYAVFCLKKKKKQIGIAWLSRNGKATPSPMAYDMRFANCSNGYSG